MIWWRRLINSVVTVAMTVTAAVATVVGVTVAIRPVGGSPLTVAVVATLYA